MTNKFLSFSTNSSCSDVKQFIRYAIEHNNKKKRDTKMILHENSLALVQNFAKLIEEDEQEEDKNDLLFFVWAKTNVYQSRN